MKTMKRVSTMLLIVLLSAVCLPLTIAANPADSGSFLISLDVCSQSGSFMSVNADSPAIQEGLSEELPLLFIGYIHKLNLAYQPFVFAVAEDRPPIV